LAFALTVGAPPANGATISLTVAAEASFHNDVLTVHVTITNNGDAAAQSIVPILRFREHNVRGNGVGSLGSRDKFQETLTLAVSGLAAGRWPFQVAIDYTDSNRHPFQALHVSTIDAGSQPSEQPIEASITVPPLAGSARARVVVKNLTNVARTATVQVFAATGLEVQDLVIPIDLDRGEEKSLTTTIVNRTALGGSRYPVFAVVQSAGGAGHQTVVAHGTIDVLRGQSLILAYRYVLWSGAAALLVAWIVFVLIHRRRPTG
jgi:hypothetical protein